MSANRYRRRGAPQGRPPLHHRHGPLHRRHQPARARPTPISCARRTPMPRSSRSTPRRLPAMPGVLAVLTGAELAADKIGNLICGWMIHSKDGTPMKMAAHPALAAGKACHRRRCGRGGDRRDAGAGARRRREGRGRLRGAARGRRSGRGAEARRAADSRRSRRATRSTNGISATPRRSDAAFKSRQARHQARHRQQPAGAERDGAARRDRRLRRRHRAASRCGTRRRIRTSRGSSSRPSSAWRRSTSCASSRPMSAAASARRSSSIPKRWWRCGPSKQRRPPGEMGRRPLRGLPRRRAWPRSRHPCRNGVRRATARSPALRAKTIANLGAYMSTFSSSVPTYLYATLLSGQYDIPHIYCEVDAVYTNTAPVDAYRGAGRPEATFVVERLIEVGARELGQDPAELRRKNFISKFPHQTPVIMTYDAGDYDASLKKAMELADCKGFAKRKRESARHGKLRGIGFSDLYRGLRHRAVAGGRLARRRRRLVGIRRGAGQSDRLGRSPHRLATPTARATRPPSRSSCRSGSAFRSTTSRSCTATPTRCSSAWAPTARAPARSACRRSSRRSTRSRPRPRRSPRICSKPPKPTSSSRTASSRVAGTDKSAALGRRRAQRLYRAQILRRRSWSPA